MEIKLLIMFAHTTWLTKIHYHKKNNKTNPEMIGMRFGFISRLGCFEEYDLEIQIWILLRSLFNISLEHKGFPFLFFSFVQLYYNHLQSKTLAKASFNFLISLTPHYFGNLHKLWIEVSNLNLGIFLFEKTLKIFYATSS